MGRNIFDHLVFWLGHHEQAVDDAGAVEAGKCNGITR